MTNHIFVLSYCGAQEFFDNIDVKKFPNSVFYFIDNGQQSYNPTFECFTFTTAKNIGCAGGWNLICDIAFDHFGLTKIIITQDDATFTEEHIEDALSETQYNCLTGVYAPYFEFSCFGIHRDIWEKVGRFDENFIYVYSEDADYKQRCMLNSITVNSLMVPSKGANKSLTVSKNPNMNKVFYNREYLKIKWGNSIHPSPSARADMQAPFDFKFPFETNGIFDINFIPMTSRIQKVYYPESPTTDNLLFPSVVEYDRFIKREKKKVF